MNEKAEQPPQSPPPPPPPPPPAPVQRATSDAARTLVRRAVGVPKKYTPEELQRRKEQMEKMNAERAAAKNVVVAKGTKVIIARGSKIVGGATPIIRP